MPKRQQKPNKEKPARPKVRDGSERAGDAGPLQSHGLTEMQMIEKAINTKPPKRNVRED